MDKKTLNFGSVNVDLLDNIPEKSHKFKAEFLINKGNILLIKIISFFLHINPLNCKLRYI